MISTDKILYTDNHLLIVNKMAGEIVQGDKTGDEPLSERVKNYIKLKYKKPGAVYLGTVHRIDRPVSGIVVFARTSKALTRMNEIFRNRQVVKTYLAVVKEKPKSDKAILVNWLKKNQQKNKSTAYPQEKPGALKAELEYEVVGKSDQYFLLKVNPLTGRHHQIRVQMSKIGCPIKGDLKYGSKRSNPDGSISLHAWKIAFEHPVKKTPLEITAPLPPEPLWDYFNKIL
jgi:23S rRNA pseudouridine1911/1915/1917 synthase